MRFIIDFITYVKLDLGEVKIKKIILVGQWCVLNICIVIIGRTEV